ncbi:MAG TPA: cytochrome b N-terminal domain-containing protein [Candidatus Bathyarchaeia archaeon]|nr:cytochrome b N-terminal domain-containing protein [Candidatus Bathyarchaeia archaeon]
MAAPSNKKKRVLDPIIALLQWTWERLERTLLLGLKIVFPSRFISPLGFLGMLTVIVFIILGVTGALLLFHFTPFFGNCPPAVNASSYIPSSTCNQAYNSVQSINNNVAWGSIIRNIHYHASNAMVLLAVMHMFYQYFGGRYKLRYEILWVTGIVLGVVTVIEAYTGYDLIFNIRGQLAINIGQTLTYYSPVIGANLAQIIFGFSFNDLAIRFYAFHVFIIPIIMLAIMAVHLPRNLVLDIPVASAITGVILIMGGLFPVDVGVRYDPNLATQITFPEWYFTSLYAFIRVHGLNPFIAGAIIPAIFVLIFLVAPFFDRGRKIAMIDRPFWVALGVASLGQIAIVTVWGFRAANPLVALHNENQLVIDPTPFAGSLLIATAIAYGSVYAFARWRRAKIDQLRAAKKPLPFRKLPPYMFSKSEVYSLVGGLLLLQGFLDLAIFRALLDNLNNLVLLEIGMVLVAFAATVHIYRVANQAK